MKILMQTADRATAERFLRATQNRGTQRLTVLGEPARVMERLFRDPFDALIVDAAQNDADWVKARAALCPKNLFLLLPPTRRTGLFPASVVYGFMRSCAADTVLERVDQLSEPGARPAPDERAAVSAALQEVGVPTHLSGFPMLKDALRLLLRFERLPEMRMTEDVYGLLAETLHIPATAVEHAMRHAIEAAWLRADARVLEQRFGYTVDARRATPSNAAFL